MQGTPLMPSDAQGAPAPEPTEKVIPSGLTLLGQVAERLENHTAHITMDQSGIVTSWQAEMVALCGYTAKEAVGRLLTDLIIPEPLHADHLAGLERWRQTQVSQIACTALRTVARHKEGHHLAIVVSVQVVVTPDGTRFLGWLQEVPADG